MMLLKYIFLVLVLLTYTNLYGQIFGNAAAVLLGPWCESDPDPYNVNLPPNEQGLYLPVFDNGFIDDVELDQRHWQLRPWGQGPFTYPDGGSGNLEHNTLNNVRIEDEKLIISAVKEEGEALAIHYLESGAIINNHGDFDEGEELPNLREYEYTSSSLWTKKFFHYGIYEITCKVPKGKGLFPAFWMYSEKNINTSWYNTYEDDVVYREVDVFEFSDNFTWRNWPNNYLIINEQPPIGQSPTIQNLINNEVPNQTNKFWHTNVFGPENLEHEQCPINFTTDDDLSEDMHTYTLEWTPYYMKWSLDGTVFRIIHRYMWWNVILGEGVFLSGPVNYNQNMWNKIYENPHFPTKPMKIITNLAIEGGYTSEGGPYISNINITDINTYLQFSYNIEPNPVPENTVLGELEIEDIRYYKKINTCGQDLILNSTNTYIDDHLYNVFVGSYISIDDIDLEETNFYQETWHQNQLTLIYTDSIVIGDEFDVGWNIFETIFDPEFCTKSLSTSNSSKSIENEPETHDFFEEQFIITPNPNKGNFTIDFNVNKPSKYTIKITDHMGRVLLTTKSGSYDSCPIDLSNESAGVYFVQFQNMATNKISIEKVIIE